MSDWYISSVAYAAVTQWAATTAVSLGEIRRQLAAQTYPNERCFRVTTAGTTGGSEPSWNRTNNATTTDGTVTWTECTAQSNHQHDNGVTNTWTAPASYFDVLSSAGKNIVAAGDRIFASSDHSEVIATSGRFLVSVGSIVSPVVCISVSRTSTNIPPTSAEITSGATISCSVTSGNLILSNNSCKWVGFTFSSGGGGSASAFISLSNSQAGTWHFKDCTFVILGTGAAGGVYSTNNTTLGARVVLENPTFNFASASHRIWLSGYTNLNILRGITFTGSIPGTSLFGDASSTKGSIYINGADLSSISGTLFTSNIAFMEGPTQLANCKLHASVTIISTSSDANSVTPAQGILELINCDSANTNYRNSWYHFAGSVVTETTITRTNGAIIGGTKISHKMVSSATHVGVNAPLEHIIYGNNSTTGSSLTATVEFISSGTLLNTEVWGELEYLGNSGSCLSSFGNDTITDILTSAANQTSSAATWDSSPATPITQKLQITFTAQKIGLIKFIIKLAKVSTTVYIDPKITIT